MWSCCAWGEGPRPGMAGPGVETLKGAGTAGVPSACRRAFSPLEGFMSEQQYTSVVQGMRLPVRSCLTLLVP